MLNSPTQPLQTAPASPDMAACWAMVRERREYLSTMSQQFQQVVNLIHFLDPTLMKVAGNRLRLGAAPGVDRVTPSRYRRNLDHNINQLITEVQHKSYQPWPARRVSIPKDDGSLRHLGLPATRDKHLQGAVLVLLEAIYEPHFYDHSYGFRPNRSAKKALRVLLDWIATHDGAWMLEVDLSKFFDTIPHDQLLDVITEKVGDRVIRHLLHAWLKAGVMDGDVLVPSERGTPQGGVISPLAANVYLDKALDQWITGTYLPTLKGEGFLVRYADDFVLCFTDEAECRKAAIDVTTRLEEFGLTVNQKKTKLTDLRKPTMATDPVEKADVNFLGFTLYWTPCPTSGWKLAARTSEKSVERFKERLESWIDKCGNLPLGDLTDSISKKVRGHRGYFNVDGNEDRILLVEEMARTMCEAASEPPPLLLVDEQSPLQQLHASVPHEDYGVDCQIGTQNY